MDSFDKGMTILGVAFCVMVLVIALGDQYSKARRAEACFKAGHTVQECKP